MFRSSTSSLFTLALIGCVLLVAAACDSDSPTLPTTSGTLLATVATAGTDLDPDGYTVTTTASNGDTTIVASVQINDTLRYDNLPTGAYTVGISGLAGNCTVNEDLWTVTVVANSTNEAPFAVACLAP